MSNRKRIKPRLIDASAVLMPQLAIHLKAEREACLHVGRNIIAEEYGPELLEVFDALSPERREQMGRRWQAAYREARATALEKP